jgi:hypothetical protein
MARDTAEAEAGMKGITFPAWHGKHYVTLAELLVRLGSFGLDLTGASSSTRSSILAVSRWRDGPPTTAWTR